MLLVDSKEGVVVHSDKKGQDKKSQSDVKWPYPALSTFEKDRFCRSRDRTRSRVRIGVSIYSVSELDAVAQTFAVSMKLQIKWSNKSRIDPEMLALKNTGKFLTGQGPFIKNTEGRFADYLVKPICPTNLPNKPFIQFGNNMDNAIYDGNSNFYLSPNNDPGVITWEQLYSGTFSEMMELERFPWDMQDLHIIIRMPNRIDRFRAFEPTEIKMKSWFALSEWDIYKPKFETKMDAKGLGTCTIVIPTKRKSRYYELNVMGIMGGICILSFTVISIAAVDFADRMSVLLTVLLTAVAFKLVISDGLPKVSYMTGLDVYLTYSFITIFLVCVENAILAALHEYGSDIDLDFLSKLDRISIFLIFVFYVLFHFWFGFNVHRMKKESLSQLKDTTLLTCQSKDTTLKDTTLKDTTFLT